MIKKMNKKGVFGLNAIQTFFVAILGIALLAYVIVIIMGTLGGSTILRQNTDGSASNETVTFTDAGTALSANSYAGCSATIVTVYNVTNMVLISSGNYSVTGCTVRNLTSEYSPRSWNVTYTYTYDSTYQRQLTNVMTNTSTGVSSFFGSISPVYAILAVLVIILILVVLVRVVQSPKGSAPQL